MKILVVEDEEKLNKIIVLGLQKRGYAVDFAFDGRVGESMARVNEYDVIISDIMMPEQNGVEMCAKLREAGIKTPFIFLTALGDVEDKILGLDTGADDYIVKPFSFDELLARIRAALRRGPQIEGDILHFEELIIDTRSQTVTIGDQQLELTLREYALLEYFLRNQSVVITREDILTHVWDQFFDSFSNVVDVHIKNLRKKLPKPYAKRLQTVWGKGYKLV